MSGDEITEYSIRYSCNSSNLPNSTVTVPTSCAIDFDGSFTCGTPQPYCPSGGYAVVFEVRGTFGATSVSGDFDLGYQPSSPFPGACCYRYDVGFDASIQPPSPFVGVEDVEVIEGDTGTSLAQFPVYLTFGVDAVVTVDWGTVDGSADAADYTPASGTVTFDPQQTEKTVGIEVIGDTRAEGNEVFYLQLSNPTNASMGDQAGACHITDDDDPPETLLDQTDSGSAHGKVTQDFEPSDDAYDCEAADDFTVPAGGWRVERVMLSGHYDLGGGPVEGVHVAFHRDEGGWPGEAAVCSYFAVVPTSDNAGVPAPGMIVVDLPTECVLTPGSYWLLAQARMDYAPRKQFYWTLRTAQSGNESVWRNPGDAYGSGFTEWARMTDTIPVDTEPDLVFLLAGDAAILVDGFETGLLTAWSETVGGTP